MSGQQRVPVAYFNSFEKAVQAKKELAAKYPDNKYQVRRRANGFKLVRRFPSDVVEQARRPSGKRKVLSSMRKKIADLPDASNNTAG